MLPTKIYERSTPSPTTLPSQSPRLLYFISRSNGNFVPLIPADEIPYTVRLKGVPRAMKIEHSCGMSHVGSHAFTGQLFQLESVDVAQRVADRVSTGHIDASGSKQRFATPNAVLHPREQCRRATSSPPRSEQCAPQQLPVSVTANNWRRLDDAASARSQEIIDNIVAQGSQSPAHKPETTLRISRTPASSPRSSSEQSDKIYCSYWIRSGECDYTQQGCRYKHEMPDRQTLASIGFRTVPRWWQEKVAIQFGQSAIPTVRPVRKPAEWLKQRRESQGSQSDNESGSEQDSEAGDGKESDVEAAPASVKQPSAAVLCPASNEDEEGAVSEPESLGNGSDMAVAQTPAIATTETVVELCRPPPNVDLIDLSPMSPTETSSCKSHGPDTLGPTKTIESSPAQPPASSSLAVMSHQAATSPRKVFVPAGESTEFHLTEARKHAQTRKVDVKNSTEPKQDEPKGSKFDTRPTTLPVSILKHSGPKAGLKASMHAHQPTREDSPRGDSPSDAKESQRKPAVPSPPTYDKATYSRRAKLRGKYSPECSRATPQNAEALKSTTRKAEPGHVKDGSPKAAWSGHRQIPRSVCRPRRPAAGSPKAVASRVVTGVVKE
jgi:hypothetical protein